MFECRRGASRINTGIERERERQTEDAHANADVNPLKQTRALWSETSEGSIRFIDTETKLFIGSAKPCHYQQKPFQAHRNSSTANIGHAKSIVTWDSIYTRRDEPCYFTKYKKNLCVFCVINDFFTLFLRHQEFWQFLNWWKSNDV